MQASDFTLLDQRGEPWTLSEHLDTARIVVFLRGDWWSYCNGQLVSLSDRYETITGAGGRVVCISVDSPLRNAALVQKLKVQFPILSDPDRSGAIEPYGVEDPKDERNIARPAIFVVAPDREVVYSAVSRDFADRTSEEAAVASLIELTLPPTTPEEVQIGPAEPGPHAMKIDAMVPYYRGAMYAVRAMRARHPEIGDDASEYIAQMGRYAELSKALRKDD